jgi:hypothetical protein
MKRPFAITAVIVVSSLIAAGPASAGPGKVKVACAKSVLPPVKVVGKVRPTRCVLYGDRAVAFVRSMHWKNWGHHRASGKGEWCSARLCMPAHVKLRHPKRGFFSKAKVRASGGPLEGEFAEIRLVTRSIRARG